MRALRIELVRGPALLAFPLLVVLGFLGTRSSIVDPSVWTYTCAQIVQSTALIAPAAAGLAAWAGMRAPRRGTRDAHRLAARSCLALPALEWASMSISAIGSYAVVAVTLMIRTERLATWGGPSWFWLGEAALGLAAYVGVGYLVGRAAPWLLTPVVVLVAAYLVNAIELDGQGRWWGPLLPVSTYVWVPFDDLNGTWLGAQVLWCVGLLAVVAAALVVLGGTSRRAKLFSAAVAVVLLVAGAGAAASADGAFYVFDRHDVWTCQGSRPQVCVQPAFDRALGDVATAFQPAANRLSETPFAFTRLEQHTGGMGVRPSPGATAFDLDANDVVYIHGAVVAALEAQIGLAACPARPTVGAALSQIVVGWAVGDMQFFVPGDAQQARANAQFLSLPDQPRWVTEHASAIRHCVLTLADFSQ